MQEKKLKPKQILFCEEYLKTYNATQSYMKVYNCTYNTARNNGSVLLANTCIKKYIEERIEKTNKEKIADANEILEFLTSTLRGEVKDQLGFETSVKDRIKAGELLAKRYRLFDEKEETKEEEKPIPTIEVEIIDNSNLEQVLYENRNE